MKLMLRVLTITTVLIFLALSIGCGPSSAPTPKTEPTVEAPTPPPIEELRKPVAKDPGMFKVIAVIKEYGKLKKQYMSFEKYKKLTKGQVGGALDPDWFYDSYVLNLNENNYFIKVMFGTSKRAIDRDDRIEKVMAGLPVQSITIDLKTPRGNTYLLTDAQADGILDYAADPRKKSTQIDIKLLDTMQEKYTWIIGLCKKHYKKLKK